MKATNGIRPDKRPDLKNPMQRHEIELTDKDIARLNNKREELINVLRCWHHCSRMQADRIISDWLRSHGEVRLYRTGQILPQPKSYGRPNA